MGSRMLGPVVGLPRLFRVASAAMALLFAFAAAVQANDPDPIAWILLYAAAAALAALAAAGRAHLGLSLAAAALFSALAVLWAPSLPEARPEAFTSVRMKAAEDEEPRETIGLALCAAWSSATALAVHRARRRDSLRPSAPRS